MIIAQVARNYVVESPRLITRDSNQATALWYPSRSCYPASLHCLFDLCGGLIHSCGEVVDRRYMKSYHCNERGFRFVSLNADPSKTVSVCVRSVSKDAC